MSAKKFPTSVPLAVCPLALLFAFAAAGLNPGSAAGDVFVVTKEVDDNGSCAPGDCALREAVDAANARPGADVIEVPAGVYPLTLEPNSSNIFDGALSLEDDVEVIAPAGAVIVGSGPTERPIFTIARSTVRLEGLTITGGRSFFGAAIWAVSDVVLDRCWITGNEGTQDGPIFLSASRMEIVNSTISNNTTNRRGGAIFLLGFPNDPAFLLMRNSTISGNSALEGGAIASLGADEIRIENSTITNNPVRNHGSVIYVLSGIGPTFTNSILDGDCVNIIRSLSEGGNVGSAGETHCRLEHPTDLPNQPDLGLLPLDRYGGPTPTHALAATSPAIDHALDANCPATDQRGLPRPFDGNDDGNARCDAGAVEYQGLVPRAIPVLSPGVVFLLAGLLALAGLAVLRRRARG